MNDTRARKTDVQTSGFSDEEVQPTMTVAPEPKGRRGVTVIREPDETDSDYEARCAFMARVIDAVEMD